MRVGSGWWLGAAVTWACGGAGAEVAGAPCPGSDPGRVVNLSCEVAQRSAGGESVVSRPKITTRTGRPASITVESGGNPPTFMTVDLNVRGDTSDLYVDGRGRLEVGRTTVATAAAAAPQALTLLLESPGGTSYTIRCSAEDAR